MGVAVKDQHHPNNSVSRHSKRLKELNDEAARVRLLHQDGKITQDEASAKLKELRARYRSFIDRFL